MKFPLIVAELSANHNGDRQRLYDLWICCKAAGADAIKLQTWSPDSMVIDRGLMVDDGPWKGWNMTELYRKSFMSWDWQYEVFKWDSGRMKVFSSVFDIGALQFLESMGCPMYKIASFEITDLPLIAAVASTRKPMVISTGMANIQEISDAFMTARQGGCSDITLLKCTSAYPADPASANLQAMARLGNHFHCKVGLSDHTPGIGVALAAVAMGATMIEKHVTLDRGAGGLDDAFSIEPDELAALVIESRRVAVAMGDANFGPTEEEKPQLKFRRSLYVIKDMEGGEQFTSDCLTTARPAIGISPAVISKVLKGKAKHGIRAGTLLTWDMVEK